MSSRKVAITLTVVCLVLFSCILVFSSGVMTNTTKQIDGTWTQVSNLTENNYNIIEIENDYAVIYKFFPEYGTYEYVDFGNVV